MKPSRESFLSGVVVAALVAALAAAVTTETHAAPRSALMSSGYSGGGIGVASPLVGSVTVGWEFVPQTDIWVAELGFFDLGQDGLNTSHEVGIWDESEQLLVSATLAWGTAAPLVGEYRYASVTPVLLEAGQTFVIGATVPVSLRDPPAFISDMYPNDTFHIDPQAIMFDRCIGLGTADRYTSDIDGSFSDPLAFPDKHLPPAPWIDPNTGQQIGIVERYHFAPNFRFVPEPTALSLVAVGAVLLLRRSLRVGRRCGQ